MVGVPHYLRRLDGPVLPEERLQRGAVPGHGHVRRLKPSPPGSRLLRRSSGSAQGVPCHLGWGVTPSPAKEALTHRHPQRPAHTIQCSLPSGKLHNSTGCHKRQKKKRSVILPQWNQRPSGCWGGRCTGGEMVDHQIAVQVVGGRHERWGGGDKGRALGQGWGPGDGRGNNQLSLVFFL